MAVELKDVIIGLACFFVLLIALLMPYKEIGEATSFSGYNGNVSDKIGAYEMNVTSFSQDAKDTYDQTNNINSTKFNLGSAVSGGFDFLGTLVQAGFNAARGSVKLVSDGYFAITDVAKDVGVPSYFVALIVLILFIIVAFALIKLLTGRFVF